jgi:type IV secretion system protein VirD4
MNSNNVNPLANLNPANEDEFTNRAATHAAAIVEIESKDSHWSENARGLLQALIMWEAIEAKGEAPPAPKTL